MPTLKNFTASVRKPALTVFGIFPIGYDLSWIESIASNPPGIYVHPASITGDMDGVNTVFTLPGISTTPSQVVLIWNGLVLAPASYVSSGGTITMQAGYIPESGDNLVAYVWS